MRTPFSFEDVCRSQKGRQPEGNVKMRNVGSRLAVVWTIGAIVLMGSRASAADYSESVPPPPERDRAPSQASPTWPRIGGHLGVAVPYLQVSKKTSLIGQNDFFTIATPVGLSIHASEKWTIDFEFIVTNSILKKEATGLIVDPGAVYHWGPINTGLRLAIQTGATTNVGVIPLVNKGFALPFGTWFVEAAFPTFVQDRTVTFNAVIHSGIGF